MKSNQPLITSGALLKRSAAITTGALLLMASASASFAQSNGNQLSITENSSTSLTVSYNGGSITPTQIAGDHWQFSLPSLTYIGEGGEGPGVFTVEPGAEGQQNLVNTVAIIPGATSAYGTVVDVVSDTKPTGTDTQITDGVSTLSGVGSNGDQLFISFHDAGDKGGGNTVPDASSTALLAAVSLLGLFGMSRFCTSASRAS